MKKYFNPILALLLLSTLSSCGYQLRGSVDMVGLDNVRIISNSRTNISKILEQKFSSDRQSDLNNVAGYPAIKIISIARENRQLSVNSFGRVDEYEITKSLSYQFIFSDEKKFSGIIKASASYDFNESQMQGTKEREKIADDNIDRTLVRKLIYKFRSTLKSNS